MTKKQKLELTWIGKENRPRLEPRILLEDPGTSLLRQRMPSICLNQRLVTSWMIQLFSRSVP